MKIQVLLLALFLGAIMSQDRMMDPEHYDDYYYMNMTEMNMGADHGPYVQSTRIGYYYGYVEYGFMTEFMFLPANTRVVITIPASVIEAQAVMYEYDMYSKGFTGRKQATDEGMGPELNFFFYDWDMTMDLWGANYTIDAETGDYTYTFDLNNEYACVLSGGARYFYLGQLYPPMDTGMIASSMQFTDQNGNVFESGDFLIELTDWKMLGMESMGEQLKDDIFEFSLEIDYIQDSSFPLIMSGFEGLGELTSTLEISCVENCMEGATVEASGDMAIAIYNLLPASVSSNTTVVFQLSGLTEMNINSMAYLGVALHNSFGGFVPVMTFRQTDISGNITCWETRFAAGSKNRDYYCNMMLDQGVTIRAGDEIELSMSPNSDYQAMWYDTAYFSTGDSYWYEYADSYQDQSSVFINNFYIDGQTSLVYLEWYYLVHKNLFGDDPKVKVKMIIRDVNGKKVTAQGGLKAEVFSYDLIYEDEDWYY